MKTISSSLTSNYNEGFNAGNTGNTGKKESISLQEKLREGIKAYRDKHFSGLTDEQREKIQELIKEYKMKYPIETEEQMAMFNAFVESLHRKFGAKYVDGLLSTSGAEDGQHNPMPEPDNDIPNHVKGLINKPFPTIEMVLMDVVEPEENNEKTNGSSWIQPQKIQAIKQRNSRYEQMLLKR